MGNESSYEDLATIVRGASAVWHSADEFWMGTCPEGAVELALPTGVTYFSPEDLVISIAGGTTLAAAQETASARNLMIPLGQTPFSSENPTVAEAIGLALPHVLENRYGTWREWVLGMTVVLGDGMIAKSGCRAVKSVAGYDAHKLFVGSRGAFGVIVEVTLRLYPLEDHRHELPHQRPQDAWICRLLKSDFERICTEARNRTVLADPETATLWGKGELPKLPPDSWMVGPNNSPKNSGSRDEAIWLQRAKALLDPMGKLNPGQLEAFL